MTAESPDQNVVTDLQSFRESKEQAAMGFDAEERAGLAAMKAKYPKMPVSAQKHLFGWVFNQNPDDDGPSTN